MIQRVDTSDCVDVHAVQLAILEMCLFWNLQLSVSRAECSNNSFTRRYLANVVLTKENVPGGQVPMDIVFLGEVLHATGNLTTVGEKS